MKEKNPFIPFNSLVYERTSLKTRNLISHSYFGLLSMQEENISDTLIKDATNLKCKPV